MVDSVHSWITYHWKGVHARYHYFMYYPVVDIHVRNVIRYAGKSRGVHYNYNIILIFLL